MMRGQSHVVGVAVLLGLTVLSVAIITAGIGTVFDAQASKTDARRVADGLQDAIQPVSTTGPRTGTVAFSQGRLRTTERDLRVYRNGTGVATTGIDALVFTAGDRRVAAVGGAVVRGRPGAAWLTRPPPIVSSSGVLVIGAASLNTSDVAVAGGGRTRLHTNVSHRRSALGEGRFRVEIETRTPRAVANHFATANASVTRIDRDGDGIESVVAEFSGTRTGYLVNHDLDLEVGDG